MIRRWFNSLDVNKLVWFSVVVNLISMVLNMMSIANTRQTIQNINHAVSGRGEYPVEP